MAAWVCLASVVLASSALASSALAQVAPGALVDRGVAAYEEADFDGALAAFREAEAAGLDRAQLVRVLAHRVLIAHASEDAPTLEREALRLVSLDPEALRDQASPALVRALEAARARADGLVRLRVTHEVAGDGLALRARVEGDVAGLVSQVHLRARRGDGPMVEAVDGVVTLPGTGTEGVLVVADCVGPAGAILATLGTNAPPRPLAAEVAETVLAPPPPSSGGDDTGLVVGLVVGGVVLVAAAIVVGVLVADASNASSSQLMGPVVEW